MFPFRLENRFDMWGNSVMGVMSYLQPQYYDQNIFESEDWS